MEVVINGMLILCEQIYTNAVLASSNVGQCKELAEHVRGIESMLKDMLNDFNTSPNKNFPPALDTAIWGLKDALELAASIIEVYGKRGRILRYVLATKVQSEFNGAFKRIDDALQRLSAVNVHLVTNVKTKLDSLTSKLENLSYRLTKEMEKISQQLNLLYDQNKNRPQKPSFQNSLWNVMSDIPGLNSSNIAQADIDDLIEAKNAIKAQKEELDALMLEQIIEALQQQQQQQQQKQQHQVSEPPQQIVCPLTLEIMKDPVILHPAGQTYERSAIQHWFERGNNTDPVTRIQIQGQPILSINYAVKDMIDDYYKKNQSLNSVDSSSAPSISVFPNEVELTQQYIQYQINQNNENNLNGNINGYHQMPKISQNYNDKDGRRCCKCARWVWALIVIIFIVVIAVVISTIFFVGRRGGGGGGDSEDFPPPSPSPFPQSPQGGVAGINLPSQLDSPDPKPAQNIRCLPVQNSCRAIASTFQLQNEAISELQSQAKCLIQFSDDSRCKNFGGPSCKFEQGLDSLELAPNQCVPNIQIGLQQLPNATRCFPEFETQFLTCVRNTNSQICPSGCSRTNTQKQYNCVPAIINGDSQQSITSWLDLLNQNQFLQFQNQLSAQLIQTSYYCKSVVVPLVVFDLQGKNFTNIDYIAEFFWEEQSLQSEYRGFVNCYSRDASSC